MAAAVIGALRVNLGLDSANFERGAKRVQSPLASMRKQFLAVAGVAAAMGAALSAAAIKGAQDIDRAAKAARRLDSSITGFRALELAADEAGVSLSGMTNDIQTMNRELASIGTSGNGARALEALGLSIDDLEGKDADEKLAIIADQVQALGLSAGETTAILRDLGVRNREMALLVLGGGDAIRAARGDIEDYGLAISDVDASTIEKANDRIGRLGLITQYAGQQLALALVPAMGRLAEVMTESLRAGGLLREVIDGLVGNLDRLAAIVSVAVLGFGTRYVAALLAARIATGLFTGSMVALKLAIARTGIGLLIVGAAELVVLFGRSASAAEDFKTALDKVLGVQNALTTATETFYNTVNRQNLNAMLTAAKNARDVINAQLEVARAELKAASFSTNFFGTSLGETERMAEARAAIQKLSGDLLEAESRLSAAENAANNFTTTVTNQEIPNGLNAASLEAGALAKNLEAAAAAIAGVRAAAGNLGINTIGLNAQNQALQAGNDLLDARASALIAQRRAELEGALSGPDGAANYARRQLEDYTNAVNADTEAQRLNAKLRAKANQVRAGGGVAPSDRLAEPLKDAEDGAGALDEVNSSLDAVSKGFDTFKSSVASAFEGLITGALSFKDALGSVLNSLANVFAQAASTALFSGFKLPEFANGTNNAPGGMALVGERGPELVNLPRGSQVRTASDTSRMMGGVGGNATITIVAPEGFSAQQQGEIQGIAVNVTSQGISSYDRTTLPGSVNRINSDPRRRG
jgi:hypothetical protein